MSPCDNCTIKGPCNFIDPRCRLLSGEVAVVRPDLIKTLTRYREYYWRNREKILELAKQRGRAYDRKYRKNNKARRLQTEREWRNRYRDSINERQRKWWEQNKNEINAKRREKRAGNSY